MLDRIEIPESVLEVMHAVEAKGHRIYVVGGAVRNFLLRRPIKDWDLATDAVPGRVKSILASAGYQTIDTGLKHGTITVITYGGNVEITTFRTDVVSDGRHSEVEFSTSISEDASRRDFTMNALYAGVNGLVWDPTGLGFDDLYDRTLRFIGIPSQRIQEDTLRVLRAFRLSLAYDLNIEINSLLTIRCLPPEILSNLSSERVISELSRMNLSSPKSVQLNEIFPHLESVFGKPLKVCEDPSVFADLPWFYFWYSRIDSVDWFLRTPGVTSVERDEILLLHSVTFGEDSWELAYRHGLERIKRVQKFLKIVWPDFSKTPAFTDLPIMIQPCPLRGPDFMPEFTGKDLGDILKTAVKLWCEYRFCLDPLELMKLTLIKHGKF